MAYSYFRNSKPYRRRDRGQTVVLYVGTGGVPILEHDGRTRFRGEKKDPLEALCGEAARAVECF